MRALLPTAALMFAVALTGCSGAAATEEGTTSSDGMMSEAAQAAAPITNFHQVKAGIYRGARPEDTGLEYLKSIGVKTIIDLEEGDIIEAQQSDIDHEKSSAEALGFTWIQKGMSAFTVSVNDAEVESILTILRDPKNYPVYVHCLHGQDRTGMVIGVERVINEGWDGKSAHDEMIKYGFHSYFEGLNHYFEEKTGFED